MTFIYDLNAAAPSEVRIREAEVKARLRLRLLLRVSTHGVGIVERECRNPERR